MMPVHAGPVACAAQHQPGPVGLLMTDDLLVATQGADQRDVRAVVGTPRATPSRYRRPITARLRGGSSAASPGALGVWKPRSLGTPGHLDMALANKATVSTILRCAKPCRTDPKPDRLAIPRPIEHIWALR